MKLEDKMEPISIEKLYELYIDTINRCGMHLLNADDDTIEYEIFEEFDIGAVSFLHPDNLLKLHQQGYISADKMKKSTELRDKVMELQNTDEWNLDSFRSSDKWKEILTRSDELKELP